MAYHLRLPVQFVKATTTVSEFYEWSVVLRQHQSKEDYYLAQIAAEIARTRVKNPGNVKTEHFLLKFKEPDGTEPTTHPSQLSPEEQKKYRAEKSKVGLAVWRGITKAGRGNSKPNKKKAKR